MNSTLSSAMVGLRLMVWLMVTHMLGGALCAQTTPTCHMRPLPFREDIRPPDVWETEWEQTWPNASEALTTWRAGQFELLISTWRGWAAHAPSLLAMTKQLELPPSAASLVWWAMVEDATQGHATAFDVNAAGSLLRGWTSNASPRTAMQQAHEAQPRKMSLDEWATSMRTGMRLMENLELPRVHVVKPGETVYSISRDYGVSPRCVAQWNGVWDDLQPGMPLIIPDLL